MKKLLYFLLGFLVCYLFFSGIITFNPEKVPGRQDDFELPKASQRSSMNDGGQSNTSQVLSELGNKAQRLLAVKDHSPKYNGYSLRAGRNEPTKWIDISKEDYDRISNDYWRLFGDDISNSGQPKLVYHSEYDLYDTIYTYQYPNGQGYDIPSVWAYVVFFPSLWK